MSSNGKSRIASRMPKVTEQEKEDLLRLLRESDEKFYEALSSGKTTGDCDDADKFAPYVTNRAKPQYGPVIAYDSTAPAASKA